MARLALEPKSHRWCAHVFIICSKFAVATIAVGFSTTLSFCLWKKFAFVKRAKIVDGNFCVGLRFGFVFVLVHIFAVFRYRGVQLEVIIESLHIRISCRKSAQFRFAQRNAQKHGCLAWCAGNVTSSEQQDVLAVRGALALGHAVNMF